MTDREKLIELIQHEVVPYFAERIADHLISNGVTFQQWIPVTERLPEKWKDVLVWSKCGFCEVAVYIGLPGKWRVSWNYTMLEADTVTHWMPLPEPPKED